MSAITVGIGVGGGVLNPAAGGIYLAILTGYQLGIAFNQWPKDKRDKFWGELGLGCSSSGYLSRKTSDLMAAKRA